ncbi:glycoside hydrolase family 79 protein [Guyanagaster necrorhizus]|uniref:Glycoside hydrolase family 79 protein n=1 Tax=Guyanagaster necrorhizus TaxID=856835 RepID=A0A9P8ATQ3_9AGAR|nr:glycoside hydrolase family 79 protein [Guyanagaster necrorhizus MCA 3950]KAG7447455.1 glycoside hydrolase family 79 protein [Guyanagaster necrorhizus MCA 3950]
MGAIRTFLSLFFFASAVCAQVTVYFQQPLNAQTSASSADAASYTGAAAYNPTVLNPPPIPDPLPPMQFGIQLQNGGTTGVSIVQSGSFVGFSIEMSVTDQTLGKNSSYIQVPFLNLMANLQQRAGGVYVRVGGNTQETAVHVDSLPDGKMIQKDNQNTTNPTQTPPLDYTDDLFYLMRGISELVNIRWFLGIPFFNIDPFQLAIAEQSQAILGDLLAGFQAGNEPDLYVRHGHRTDPYGPSDYGNEFGALVQAMGNDANAVNKRLLIGPSIATGDWFPEDVWNTDFVDTYSENLAFLAVEHYPSDNCYAVYGTGTPRDAQTMFPTYLNHSSGQSIIQPYVNSGNYAQQKNKKLLMFETNTASCGGFPGISDSFGAALWGLDYSMQMAYSNFSGALMHIGGQNVFYNPFTPPPTNQSTFHQWTIGPIYYSALIMAEAMGASNASQILDLNANDGNIFTPAYAIYENGNPVRVALFNYITDSSGASTYIASISIGDGESGQANGTPAQVKVKYFTADSVSQKGNFRWAGQTFGGIFESDGRLMGQEDIQTVTCDQNANNTCLIPVPAPGFALVFLNDEAFTETAGASSMTFATTALTKTVNTATVDQAVLSTSNGHSGMKDVLGSTSKGSQNGVVGLRTSGLLPTAFAIGAIMFVRTWVR